MPNPSELERLSQEAVVAAQSPAVTNIVNELPGVYTEAKSGYKTTEFWITLFGVLGTQIGALDLPGEHAKTIATLAFAVAYVLSRGVAKAGVVAPVSPPA